jgi:hypothetical protein
MREGGGSGLHEEVPPDHKEKPLDEDVDEEVGNNMSHRKRRLSITDDQGQSAKLALVEARVELDDLRRELVEANADRAAARLEQKCDREVASRASARHEEVMLELRKEVEAVRELLEKEVIQAEDYAHGALEVAKAREKALQSELDKVQGRTETAAASTLQRVFNKRWTRVLQERYRAASASAETADAENARLKDELEESQRALQSSAARTLQRALMPKMHIAVRAAGGDMAALEALKEERRLADVRQLEKDQAELRTALNESRRRAARLDKRLQLAESGSMIIANSIKQTLTLEISEMEAQADETSTRVNERLSATRRKLIHLSLKLSAAQAKARVCMQKVADADAALFAARHTAEELKERATDADQYCKRRSGQKRIRFSQQKSPLDKKPSPWRQLLGNNASLTHVNL